MPKKASKALKWKRSICCGCRKCLPGSLAGLWAGTATPLLPGMWPCTLVRHQPWAEAHTSCSCRKISWAPGILTSVSTLFHCKNYKIPGACSRENRAKLSSPKHLDAGSPCLPGRICDAMSHHCRGLNTPLDCSNAFLQVARMGAKAITSAPSHGLQCSKETPRWALQKCASPEHSPNRKQEQTCGHPGNGTAAAQASKVTLLHLHPKSLLSLKACWSEKLHPGN